MVHEKQEKALASGDTIVQFPQIFYQCQILTTGIIDDIDDVLKVVEQGFNRVLVVPDRVEAVGLGDLGNRLGDSVNTVLRHHAAVLKTLSETDKRRLGRLSVDRGQLVQVNVIGTGADAAGTECLVGGDAVFVEKADETLTVDLLQVALSLGDSLLSVSGRSIHGDLHIISIRIE